MCNTSAFPRAMLHPLYRSQNGKELAPPWWGRMTSVWAKVRGYLLLAVPPSDWFGCGRVKISRDCALQCGQPPLLLKLRLPGRSASRPYPCLPSFGLYGGPSIRALSFVAAHRTLAPPLGGVSISHLALLCSGVSCLHPASSYAPGSNASGFAVEAFLALPASSMLQVPSNRSGVDPVGHGVPFRSHASTPEDPLPWRL